MNHEDEFVISWESALRRSAEFQVVVTADVSLASQGRFPQAKVTPEVAADGKVTGLFVIARDVTDTKRAEAALAARALEDPLTGLPNRVLLADRIEHALSRLERVGGRIAVLFIDLNRFKQVNDRLGHGAGDSLLIEVAARFKLAARRSDTVARIGGDEFVVLCEQIEGDVDAARVAQRMITSLEAPVMVEGQWVSVQGSIGIAVTADVGASPQSLLRDADIAMYEAKAESASGSTFRFFDAEKRRRSVARETLEEQLRTALKRGEFRLFFQPLVTLSGVPTLTGAEALLRWEHPERGLLQPADFMAVAEDKNLMVPIGRWVLDEACRHLSVWNTNRSEDRWLTMAVNLSVRQLVNPGVVRDVREVLERRGVAPRLLTLDVSETTLHELGTLVASGILEALHEVGVRLAVDDFGIGYSSLGQLRGLPLDIVKIDRSFVARINDGDMALIAAFTAMAHALGMTTVGKGIETLDQLHALQGLGCDDGQGYLVSAPVADTTFAELLHRWDTDGGLTGA